MHPDHFPRDGRPEVAFVGRSNVGKSSLLNQLLNRKGLAKTSSTPGKTQTINFFEIDKRLYFVDLPGYGYARVPLRVKEQWTRLIREYLTRREPLRLAVQLLDARHPPMQSDVEMVELLEEVEVPTLLVATKFDKLNRNQRQKSIERVRETFMVGDDAVVVPFSAVTGEGAPEIWRIINEACEHQRPS